MNYKLHYENLIRKYGLVHRPNCSIGYERHHILPKSMGGSNDVTNLVYLTGRQHLVAHWLLFKIYRNREMSMAFFIMRANRSNYVLKNTEKRATENAMRMFGLMSKSVMTPLGIFSSYRDAAAAHGLCESTFQELVRSRATGFIDLGSTRAIVAASGGAHGMARRVKTPLGLFPYVGAAAEAHAVSNKSIQRKCEMFPDDFYYLDPPKLSRTGGTAVNRQSVTTPIGTFSSIMEAAVAHNLSRDRFRYLLRTKEGYYINQD